VDFYLYEVDFESGRHPNIVATSANDITSRQWEAPADLKHSCKDGIDRILGIREKCLVNLMLIPAQPEEAPAEPPAKPEPMPVE